jgi:aminopeptidase
MSIHDLSSKLAKLVVHYSLEVKKGQMIAIQGSTEALPVIKELYRQIVRVGAYPEVVLQFPGQEYIFINEAQDELLSRESSLERHIIEHCDALILIQSDPNPYENTRLPTARVNLRRAGKAGVFMTFMQRVDTPGFRFMSMPWPTQGQAVISRMSQEELMVRLEKACFLDCFDPAQEWERQRKQQQALIDRLSTVKTLRIRAEHTDLEMSVEGRRWLNCYGLADLPDGEVFSAPREDSINGTVRFSFPARNASGIQLTFEDGQVVSSSADSGEDYLRETLQVTGARRLGEVGIGTNFNITEPIGQILFDEKIGGTVHLALGSAYPASGGKNQSPLHWDLIVDLRQDGELLADGQVIMKGGRFV